MKKLLLISMLFTIVIACKKEKGLEPDPTIQSVVKWDGIYTAKYTHNLFEDATIYTYIGEPIKLYTKSNQPYSNINIGDTVYFQKPAYYHYYLYDIDNPVKAVFISQTTAILDTVSWSYNSNCACHTILKRGTLTLNMDNSVDIDYIDSLDIPVVNLQGRTRHFKVHCTK